MPQQREDDLRWMKGREEAKSASSTELDSGSFPRAGKEGRGVPRKVNELISQPCGSCRSLSQSAPPTVRRAGKPVCSMQRAARTRPTDSRGLPGHHWANSKHWFTTSFLQVPSVCLSVCLPVCLSLSLFYCLCCWLYAHNV